MTYANLFKANHRRTNLHPYIYNFLNASLVDIVSEDGHVTNGDHGIRFEQCLRLESEFNAAMENVRDGGRMDREPQSRQHRN